MAYTKTVWQDRIADNNNRFIASGAVAGEVFMVNAPTNVTQEGTPFNVADMNKIEQGIFDAHQGIADLAAGKPYDYYMEFASKPSDAEMIAWRLLPAAGQAVLISQYQRLCDRHYVGNAANATADWWYKTSDAAGKNRDVNGAYMVVIDIRGIFLRPAGANSLYKMANDTPYDGGSIGAFGQDKMQLMQGSTLFPWPADMLASNVIKGVFRALDTVSYLRFEPAQGGTWAVYEAFFNTSSVARTGSETTPAWAAAYYCIVY
jgi:hypothetical protein